MTTTEDMVLPDAMGLEHTLSPVDLPPHDPPLEHPLRWTTIVIALACAVLLPFNATALRGWAYELAPSASTERVIAASERWYDATAALGLNLPTDAMRGWWAAAQAARFESDDAAAPATPAEDLAPPPPNQAAATKRPRKTIFRGRDFRVPPISSASCLV